VRIGDSEVSREAGLAQLRAYARDHHQTVQFYDLGGDPAGQPGPGGGSDPVNEVTLADLARLAAVGAYLGPDDFGRLLGAGAAAAFAAVPATARLEDCAPGTDLHQSAAALYDCFRADGIWRAKRSRLLHIKRPWLIPIADNRVDIIYRQRVERTASALGETGAAWEVVREDLRDGAEDLAWLAGQLAADEDPAVQRAGRLTALRLLDILAWTAAGDIPAAPEAPKLHGLQAALASLDRPRRSPTRR
jgi:Family of unknown function (DUF6308)